MAKSNISAKKKKVEEKKPKQESKLQKAIVLLKSEQVQFVFGITLFTITFLLLLAEFSFLIHGEADQSKIENIPLTQLTQKGTGVLNWAGPRGAYVANLLINEWVGLPSFFMVALLALWGARLMRVHKESLFNYFLFFSILTLWLSVMLSLLIEPLMSNSFLHPGGKYGLAMREYLINNIGWMGTFLVLVGIFFIILVMTVKSAPAFIQHFLLSIPGISFFSREVETKEKCAIAVDLAKDGVIVAEADKEELEEAISEEEIEEEMEDEERDGELDEDEDDWADAPKPPATASIPPLTEEFFEEEQEIILPVEKVAAAASVAAAAVVTPLLASINDSDDMSWVTPAPQDETVEPKKEEKKEEFKEEIEYKEIIKEEDVYDGSQLGKYDPTLDLSAYKYPISDLLRKYDVSRNIDPEEQRANKQRIIETLENYGIKISRIEATVGPTITLYEIVPAPGVRISKIKNLENDIALSLAALGIRIIAPIPGKGTIGIEVPNKDAQTVSMHSILFSKKFQETEYDLPVAIGKTITNDIFMVDLCKMPHVLVAGATGQGKSVGLNAIITSLLYKKHPSQLKFVLIDPKKVEFNIYSNIERHFLAKLPDAEEAIITDFTKVVQTLNSLTKEMDMRYDLLKKANTRNIKEYNTKFVDRKLNPEKGHRYMPYIVVVIDEFGDLIMTAGKDVELPIARIAQLARAVGIHMIIATQRPSTNIITGTIKANFPARVAFRVSSMIDSRTILDAPGANQLIGRGDLLFSQGSDQTRVQCAFVDTPEVEHICDYIGNQVGYPTAFLLPEYVAEENGASGGGIDLLSDKDALFEEAARLLVVHQQGSTSLIQRKFSIGYNRAGRLVDQLESAGIVGPFEGSKARQVLVQDEVQLDRILQTYR